MLNLLFSLKNMLKWKGNSLVSYLKNNTFNVNTGFSCNANHIEKAVNSTNKSIAALPFSLFRDIDYKTVSTIIGRLFSANLAEETGSL